MATDIDTLLVKLAADTSQMRGELAKATTAMAREMQKQAKEVEKVNTALEKAGTRIKQAIGGALAGLSVSKLTQMATETMKWAVALQNQARWLGISATNLEAYERGAIAAGVEQGQFTKALEKMMGNLADANADPNSGPAKIFKQLGVDIRLAAQDMDAFLGQLANKIAGLGKNDKLVIGKTLFGDKMDDVVRVFSGGAEGLAKMRAEFQKLNPEFEETVRKGAEMGRQYEQMADQIDKGLKQALINLGPVLLSLLGIIDRILGGINRTISFANDKNAQSNLARNVQRQIDESSIIPKGLKDQSRARTEQEIARLEASKQTKVGLGSRAAEDASMDALARSGIGKKDGTIRTGAGGESELEKLLRRIREENVIARKELEHGPESAAWAKYYDDLARLQANRTQRDNAYRNFIDTQEAKGLKVLKDFASESEHTAKVAAAEAQGRRDLVAVLELEFRMRQQFGDRFVEANRVQIEQLAKQRYQIEENARLMKVGIDTLEEIGRSAFSELTSAVLAFGDQNQQVWERLRNVAVNVLNQIASKIMELGVLNPILNGLLGGSRDTLGGILGAVFKIGGAAAGGIVGGGAGVGGGGMTFGGIGARAEGGPVTAGMPYIVGEKRPELFVPNVSGTIVPRVPSGGGVTYIDARGADQAALARLESIVKSQGQEVRRWQAGERDRVLGHTADASRRGGSYSTAMGR